MTRRFIHPTAEVSPEAKIGENVKIWINAQIREHVVIGDNCIISKDVYIDKNVMIGNNCKIQNSVSVYDGVRIEDDVFIGPNVTFTNDKFPRAFNKDWQIIPTLIKKGVSLCTNATVVCGIEVGQYAMVGAGAVVTKDVPAYALVVGNPAKLVGWVCKCGKKVTKQGELCSNCEKS